MTHDTLRRRKFPGAVSHEQGVAAPGNPVEPVLDVADIQGNILVGFNKSYQTFLFLRIKDTAGTKRWLRTIVPQIASTEETLAFLRLFRAMRERRSAEPHGLVATWINIAFTRTGLEKLTSTAEVETFTSETFKLGMAQSAGILGDPTNAQGRPIGWVVGDAANPVDVLLIVASDDAAALRAAVSDLMKGFAQVGGVPVLELAYQQDGQALPGDLTGHEHFGFKDGISQPGVRGRVSGAAADFLTPRLIDPADPIAARFSRPGQPLVWPGLFVLGEKYPNQNPFDPMKPVDGQAPTPTWATNGSFLVLRRLRQDVAAFWGFMEETARKLALKYPALNGLTKERLASIMVGRWPSGAPVMRTPNADNPALAKNDFALNNFAFTNPSAIVKPRTGGSTDTFPLAPGDDGGTRCPFSAHLRKVNPRDDGTDQGGPERSLIRRILRRGIPFGPPLAEPLHPGSDAGDRGLLFLSYQASIEDQFEFLMTDWVNSVVNPRSYLGSGSAGQDPIIGNAAPGEMRAFTLPVDESVVEEIALPKPWVIPTGGGYFFAPSISAIRDVLAQ